MTEPAPQTPVVSAVPAGTAILATGRRKTSSARVRLVPGTGQILINGQKSQDYLQRPTLQMAIEEPLEVTQTRGKLDVIVNVRGGGKSGQAGAIRHGISRALAQLDEKLRPTLRKGTFLTRDPRSRERKKYGQKGARKRFQFSKR
jgi:small subunit ribosomal protein S9